MTKDFCGQKAYLQLVNLEKRYDQTVAVRRMNLSVARGEFVTLLGPSGCGKTTTLRMIAGFVAPTQGSILLDGRAIENDPPHKRNMGVVFQNYALFPHLSVADNVGFGLRMRHVPPAELADRVRKALDLVGLGALGERYPGEVSGGQQQRVALARALVIEPGILLLDEPLSNLDAGLRDEMREEISRLQRRLRITTLFVTHDQEEALALSDRVVVMQAGQVVEAAAPRDLSERPERLFTAGFLGARTVLPGRIDEKNGRRRFAAAGLHADMPADVPPAATHLVLRAARLHLARTPSAAPGNLMHVPAEIVEATYLGDTVEYGVVAGNARISVMRPSSEPSLAVGDAVFLAGGSDALAWLSEPEHHQTAGGQT